MVIRLVLMTAMVTECVIVLVTAIAILVSVHQTAFSLEWEVPMIVVQPKIQTVKFYTFVYVSLSLSLSLSNTLISKIISNN
jgi:hypothetical protein